MSTQRIRDSRKLRAINIIDQIIKAFPAESSLPFHLSGDRSDWNKAQSYLNDILIDVLEDCMDFPFPGPKPYVKIFKSKNGSPHIEREPGNQFWFNLSPNGFNKPTLLRYVAQVEVCFFPPSLEPWHGQEFSRIYEILLEQVVSIRAVEMWVDLWAQANPHGTTIESPAQRELRKQKYLEKRQQKAISNLQALVKNWSQNA